MRFKLINKPRFIGFAWTEVVAGAAVIIGLGIQFPL